MSKLSKDVSPLTVNWLALMRLGFVSNSSSSSFVIKLADITAAQLYLILNHSEASKEMGIPYGDTDAWTIKLGIQPYCVFPLHGRQFQERGGGDIFHVDVLNSAFMAEYGSISVALGGRPLFLGPFLDLVFVVELPAVHVEFLTPPCYFDSHFAAPESLLRILSAHFSPFFQTSSSQT